jgi:hypothetical protein
VGTLAFLARACARLGDGDAASELYDLLVPCRHEMAQGHVVWVGPVAHDLGLLAATLGRYDDAESHFAAAAEVEERIGALLTLVHTRLEWARMLLARRDAGDVERARNLLGAARHQADSLGMTHLAEWAEEMSRRLSQPPRPPARWPHRTRG